MVEVAGTAATAANRGQSRAGWAAIAFAPASRSGATAVSDGSLAQLCLRQDGVRAAVRS